MCVQNDSLVLYNKNKGPINQINNYLTFFLKKS